MIAGDLMIGSVSGYNSGYGYGYGYNMQIGSMGQPDASGSLRPEDADKSKTVKNPGESTKTMPGKKSSPAECETCKERKYQDGSDEMVSFKSAAHISPEAAASAVRAHEQEHVSNAYKKAAQNNGEVKRASVSIHTAICPECGRTYVSGGTTTTQIKYTNESNPYQKNRKSQDAAKFVGVNVDVAC